MIGMATTTARDGVRTSRLGATAILVGVTIWGFTNILIKLSSQPALAFAVYRVWAGSLLLLALVYASGRRLSWELVRTSAAGGAILGIEIAFFFSAVKHTSIADVSVISALQPLLVMLFAGRMFGERITRVDLAWAFASLVGVTLVAVGSSGTPVWSLFGDLLAGGSLFAWAAYFLVSKRARATVPTLEYMAVVFLVAALVVTPLALLTGQPLGGFGGRDVLFLALFVVGASAGHILVAWAHSTVDVSVSSLLTLMQPAVSSLAALWILAEPLAPLTIVGGIVVLGSLAAVLVRSASTGRKEVEQLPQV